MKKKLLLIPITLTALAPEISLVSCNEPEPEPTPIDEIIIDNFKSYPSDHVLEATFDLKSNQKYCFEIKAKHYSLTDLNNWFIFSFEGSVLPLFGGVNVEVDGVWLEDYGNTEPSFGVESGFYYPKKWGMDGRFDGVYWKYNQTKQDSVIKIHFISLEYINSVAVVSGPSTKAK